MELPAVLESTQSAGHGDQFKSQLEIPSKISEGLCSPALAELGRGTLKCGQNGPLSS